MAIEIPPEESAADAGLHYVNDQGPGLTRRRAGRGFSYRRPDGSRIADRREIDRIRRLAIPPAWTDVWICPDPLGHLQATGRDARGRKQYRYHPRWRRVRDEAKYGRLLEFGRALPAIRERVAHDLRLAGLPRDKVLAVVVRLLERTLLRIGNEEYARENETFGLTTLREGHVEVNTTSVRFRFRAKTGKVIETAVADRTMARAVARLQELPGQELFHYIDEDGDIHAVTSDDVNAYLREASGEHFTAKDFRTWAGSVMAVRALREERDPAERPTKRDVVGAIKEVAAQLGNTPAVSRASYVHPAVVNAYLDGGIPPLPEGSTRAPSTPGSVAAGLDGAEEVLVAVLRNERPPHSAPA